MISSLSTPANLALIGATGRLGREILRQAHCFPRLTIHSCFSSKEPLTSDSKVDLFLDVSSPLALTHNLEIALATRTPIVIGTTGHESLEPIYAAAKKIPVFYSANFSLGIALMKQMAALLAKRLPSLARIELKETHHLMKKDSPSGTVKMLAATLQELLPSLPISVESERVGEVIGIHELTFRTSCETLTLKHEAVSRSVFAEGALAAAQFLISQPPGFYTMEELSSSYEGDS